jgi:arylsulfatase A-like enzyme
MDSLYYEYSLVQQGMPVAYGDAAEDYATDVLAAKAVEFLGSAPLDRPFLLWFAPTAPHPPWVPAPRHAGADASMPVETPPSIGEPDVSDKPAWVRALPTLGRSARVGLLEAHRRSFEALGAVDDAVRGIVGALRERGDLDRTVIVFVSDNGYSFGEHRWVRKTCPYDECTHVPFLVRYPPAAHRVEPAVASTIDLAPTIADLAGVRTPGNVSGHSLVPLLARGDASGLGGEAFLEWAGGPQIPAWWQARTARFSYTELVTGERELYDLRRDPDELANLVEAPRYARTLARLSAALERFRRG